MNNKGTTAENNKIKKAEQQNADAVIAVNPNPAANNNIKKQLSEMDSKEKQEASELPNSEITDGEDG